MMKKLMVTQKALGEEEATLTTRPTFMSVLRVNQFRLVMEILWVAVLVTTQQ